MLLRNNQYGPHRTEDTSTEQGCSPAAAPGWGEDYVSVSQETQTMSPFLIAFPIKVQLPHVLAQRVASWCDCCAGAGAAGAAPAVAA